MPSIAQFCLFLEYEIDFVGCSVEGDDISGGCVSEDDEVVGGVEELDEGLLLLLAEGLLVERTPVTSHEDYGRFSGGEEGEEQEENNQANRVGFHK